MYYSLLQNPFSLLHFAEVIMIKLKNSKKIQFQFVAVIGDYGSTVRSCVVVDIVRLATELSRESEVLSLAVSSW